MGESQKNLFHRRANILKAFLNAKEMHSMDLLLKRLSNQFISSMSNANPENVVSSLGAMQAQDYKASLWAIGLRCKEGTTQQDVENAILGKKIGRTWLMRGTIHIAPTIDIPWMQRLFAPRLIGMATSRDRHLGLNDNIVNKANTLFYNALKRCHERSFVDLGGILISPIIFSISSLLNS